MTIQTIAVTTIPTTEAAIAVVASQPRIFKA
jgi:hypothetical protein